MDAESLATALLNGGRTESQKFRLIRETFPASGTHLNAAEVTRVQQRLAEDPKLLRLSLEFANRSRNKDFAIATLSSTNPRAPGVVATRFDWLYTPEIVMNEDFLREHLPKISHSTRLKLLNGIGAHCRDVELGDRLWSFVWTNYSSVHSDRLLAACSNELILREVSSSRAAGLKTTQLLQILGKRFDSGLELLRALIPLKNERKLKPTLNFDELMRFVLLKDLNKGIDLLVEGKLERRFGAKRTHHLLKAQAVGGDAASLDRIVQIAHRLHRPSLMRYGSRDLYLKCFLSLNKGFSPLDTGSVKKALQWLAKLNVTEKRRFLESLYQQTFGQAVMEVPTRIAPAMLHLLTTDEQLAVVEHRLEQREYRPLLESGSNVSDPKLFWQALLPSNRSFPLLKDLLANETSEECRGELYYLMLRCPILLRDRKALEEQMAFVVRRCRNEPVSVFDRISEALEEYYSLDEPLGADIWSLAKEIFEVMIVNHYTSQYGFQDSVLRSLELVAPEDRAKTEEFAVLLSKVHFVERTYWEFCYADRLREHKRHDARLIAEVMLREQEKFLEGKEEHYKAYNSLLRLFLTIAQLGLKIDLAPYPRNLAFFQTNLLDHIERRKLEMQLHRYGAIGLTSQTRALLEYAVEVATSTESRSRFEAELAEDSTNPIDVYKQMMTSKDVANLDLKILLHNRNSKDGFVLRRISQLLAASVGISPDFVDRVKHFMSDPDRNQTTTKFLAMCMTSQAFEDLCRQYIPEQLKVDPATIDLDTQKMREALLTAVKQLDDSTIALRITEAFMGGDYLKCAVRTFNYFCARAPPETTLPLLEARMTNCAVSVQKHYLRWLFVYLGDGTEAMEKVLQTATSGTTKLEVLKVIIKKVQDRGDEAWPLLKACVESVRDTESQASQFLFEDPAIDHCLVDHLPDFFRLVFSLYNPNLPKEQKGFDGFLLRVSWKIPVLPQDLTQSICEMLFKDGKLSSRLEFMVAFCLHNIPNNLAFVFAKLDALVASKDKEAIHFLRSLVRSICKKAMTARRGLTDSADLLKIPPLLLTAISKYSELFYVEMVYVELVQMMMPALNTLPSVVPEYVELAENFVKQYTLQALPLLSKRLEEVGMQMFSHLQPLLRTTLAEIFSDGRSCYRTMLGLYTKATPACHGMLLVDLLWNEEDPITRRQPEACVNFINAVQASSDLPLKILLNMKLRELGLQ